MSLQSKVRRALMSDEGFRGKPYNDATGRPVTIYDGKITIGYGRNLSDVPMSQEEALFLLDSDIERARQGCLRLLPSFELLEENRQVGLLSLVFNLGESNIWSHFGPTLELIRKGDWEGVERHLRVSLWAKQVKGRAERVIDMLCRNEYPYPEERA